MRPNLSTPTATADLASSGRVTSSLTMSRSSAAPSALATTLVFRPVATTAWPAASAAFAISTPIPRPAPVTNHTFLSIIPFPTDWCHAETAAYRIALTLWRADERFIPQSTRAATFKRLLGSRATGLQPHVQLHELLGERNQHLGICIGKTELPLFEPSKMLSYLTSRGPRSEQAIHPADIRVVFVLGLRDILDPDRIPIPEQDLGDSALDFLRSLFLRIHGAA